MKPYELPYFLSLVTDPARFKRLMIGLNTTSPSAARDVIQLMYRHRDKVPQFSERVSDFGYAVLDQFRNDEATSAVPMLEALKQSGHFSSQHLSRLRRLMGFLGPNATDLDDAIDWLRDNLQIIRCDDCDDWEYADSASITFGQNEVCRECIEDHYVFLSRYDQYVFGDDVVTALDETGDRVQIHRDDDEFCWNDDAGMRTHVDYEHEPPEPEIIASYHSSKRFFSKRIDDWTRTHKRFLGVELEVEMADRHTACMEKAGQLNELINEGIVGRNVFFERDGSLSNGFEIITHPQSLPAHRAMWRWLQNKAAIKGLMSHKSTSCGLHVHVNRDSLTKLQIAKMVAFVNNPENKDFMTALARRYGELSGYCRIKSANAKVKPPVSSDRYEAVNVTPRQTIEFRIFKGTLKYESLVAALEFVHALCEYTARCGECSLSDLSYVSFLQFAEAKLSKETQTLRAYINNRLETI